MLSPSSYVESLDLDEDMVDDVQEEIDNATQAWNKVVTNENLLLSSLDAGDSIFGSLFKELGTMYFAGEHGNDLKSLAKNDVLSCEDFVDWYVRWIFKSEGGDLNDEVEEEVSGEKGSSTWSDIKWSVAPTSQAKDGETWKCPNCRIINEWKSVKCIACDLKAPHASASSVSGFGAASSATASSAATTTSTGGFTFGGAPHNPPSSIVFGGALPASGQGNASATGFGSQTTTPVTSFTFGNVTVSAPPK
jgi:hypothetical protein